MKKQFNYHTCLGDIIVSYSEKGIASVSLPGDHHNSDELMEYMEEPCIKMFLDEFFNGKAPDPHMIQMDISVTDFQWKIYKLLMETKPGTLLTYGDVAKLLGCGSPRAVGQALRKNPVPIVIPCHRIVGKGWEGGFGGMTDGLKMEFKRFLIELEKKSMDK